MSYAEVDRTLGPILDLHVEQASQITELSARLKAADGDRDAAVKAFILSSEDPEIVKLRKAIEAAEAKIRAKAEASVVSEVLSDEDKNKLSAELDSLKDEFRTGRKAILSIAGSMSMISPEKLESILEEIGDPTRGTRGRKPGTAGSNLPKASANLTVTNGKDTWTFDTFGKAAKLIYGANDRGVALLQKEYANAAGVNHADIASVGKPQKFEVTSDQGSFVVTTTPKERKKPGPRPAGTK